jgi:hypothetical protein
MPLGKFLGASNAPCGEKKSLRIARAAHIRPLLLQLDDSGVQMRSRSIVLRKWQPSER